MTDEFRNNENRARLRDSINKPSDMPVSAGAAGRVSPGEMPPSIRPDEPLCLDPHFGGRHSFDNAERKPGEKSRSSYTDVLRRTVEPGSAKTRKTP